MRPCAQRSRVGTPHDREVRVDDLPRGLQLDHDRVVDEQVEPVQPYLDAAVHDGDLELPYVLSVAST